MMLDSLAIYSVQDVTGDPERTRDEQDDFKAVDASGAALTADLAVARGDMVEFWSADADILLSPVTSIVVDVKDTEADRDGLLHLHFMDPSLSELRSAIYALQSRNATDAS